MTYQENLTTRSRVAIRESSGVAEPAIVFCHGNSSSAHTFADLLEGRFGQTHRCLAIDFPGHGQSEPALDDAEYSLPALARVAVGAVRDFASGSCVLVGHSLGGHALTHALPELPNVLGLYLISAPPLIPGKLSDIFKADPSGCMFSGQLTPEEVQRFAETLAPEARVGSTAAQALRRSIAATDPRFRPALGASVVASQFADEAAILAAAHCPIALVMGRRDPFLNVDYSAGLAAAQLWRGGAVLIEGCGHSPHLERPRDFANDLEAFVGALLRDRSASGQRMSTSPELRDPGTF